MVGWACLPEAPCTWRLTVPVELPKRFNPVVDAPWISASPRYPAPEHIDKVTYALLECATGEEFIERVRMS